MLRMGAEWLRIYEQRDNGELDMTAPAITWNVVNRTGEDHDTIAARLRPKISKLAKLLSHFPQDAVHLQVILDSRAHDKTWRITFNLRVPSDMLHVEKEAKSLTGAMDDCADTLARRLERLKARYRQDYTWKHRRGEKMPERDSAFSVAPLPEEEGPKTHADAVVEVLKKDYERLLGFVNRQIEEYVFSGTIPHGAIEARDVVDRVAEDVLRHPAMKPQKMDYRAWCSALAFRETRKAVRRYAEEKSLAVPVDLDVSPAPSDDEALEPEEFALNLLQSRLDPEKLTLADTIPDNQAEPPDSQIEKAELVAMLRRMARGWPKPERETFELHFLEGMDAENIAQAFQCGRADVDSTIARVRGRLRTLLAQTEEETSRLKPSTAQTAAYARHLMNVVERGDAGVADKPSEK